MFKELKRCKNIIVTDPLVYLDIIKLLKYSKKVITDSGGTHKEAYLLNTPCISIKNNTEWIETINEGWNILTGIDVKKNYKCYYKLVFSNIYSKSYF